MMGVSKARDDDDDGPARAFETRDVARERDGDARDVPEDAKKPFVLITGVPGTGKTTLADALAERVGAERLDVGALARSEGFHGVYDAEMDTHELAEEALLDRMEEMLASKEERGGGVRGGLSLVRVVPGAVVRPRVRALTCVEQTATLYERLSDRGYSEKKIRENVECDIFQVVVEEAKDSFENVTVRSNATLDDMEETVRELAEWCENFKRGE